MAKEGKVPTQEEGKKSTIATPSVGAHAALQAEVLREKEALTMNQEWDEIANKDVASLPRHAVL